MAKATNKDFDLNDTKNFSAHFNQSVTILETSHPQETINANGHCRIDFDDDVERVVVFKTLIDGGASYGGKHAYLVYTNKTLRNKEFKLVSGSSERYYWDSSQSKMVRDEDWGGGIPRNPSCNGKVTVNSRSVDMADALTNSLIDYAYPGRVGNIDPTALQKWCTASFFPYINATYHIGETNVPYKEWELYNCIITSNPQFAMDYLDNGTIPPDAEYRDGNGDPFESEDTENDGSEKDDDEDTPPNTPKNSVFINGMNNYYALNPTNIETFASWFWYGMLDVGDLIVNKATKIFDGLAESVVGLRLFPFDMTPDGQYSTSNIAVGRMSSPLQVPPVNQTVRKHYGEFKYSSPKKDVFYGYEPYTKCRIFLPFVGFRDFPLAIWNGKECWIDYVVDVRTGKGTCELWRINESATTTSRTLISTYDCTLGIEIPISLEDGRGIVANMADYATSFLPSKSVVGQANLSMTVDSVHSIGSADSFTYLYEPFNVFIVTELPITEHTHDNFDVKKGRVCQSVFTLNKLKEYTECSNVRIKFDKTIPNETEEREIYSILESGFYIDK